LEKKILITPKSYYKIRDKMLPLLKGYKLVFNDSGRTLTERDMIELVHDVSGIIIGIDPVTEKVINSAPKLKAISKYGVGMDNIAIEAANDRGILLNNTPYTNNVSVAELAIGLMFAIARNIPHSVQKVKNLEWQRIKGVELTGKNFGLIGCGNIGKEVVRRAYGLQMKIKVCDPYFNDLDFAKDYNIEMLDLDKLLSISDFISLHLPFNKETKNYIAREEMKKMKNSAILINTARGGLISEDDLLWALEEKEIAGAACDVFASEPPEEHPLLAKDNFILTPHMGANTREAVLRMATSATRNLLNMLNK